MAIAKRRPKKAAAAAAVPDICFVIMPFGGWLDDYYETIYRPAIVAAGLEPHRADDLFRPSTIVTDVWGYTKKAKLLLADLTGKNPNVFYELGLAHALAKPAILVAESMEDIPFDLRALRIILYDKNAPDWGSVLKEKVQSAMREVLQSPVDAVLPAFLDVKQATARPTVSDRELGLIEIRQELDLLRREVRSRTGGGVSHPTDIGPDAALDLIRSYIRQGLPDFRIVDLLRRLGPPTSWIIEEVRRARSEGAAEPAQAPLKPKERS